MAQGGLAHVVNQLRINQPFQVCRVVEGPHAEGGAVLRISLQMSFFCGARRQKGNTGKGNDAKNFSEGFSLVRTFLNKTIYSETLPNASGNP